MSGQPPAYSGGRVRRELRAAATPPRARARRAPADAGAAVAALHQGNFYSLNKICHKINCFDTFVTDLVVLQISRYLL